MSSNHFEPSKFRLVVTSGATREWIDPVRFISNPSTGKTGYEIAKEGQKIFREVIYISGYTKKEYQFTEDAKNIHVDTTQEMAETVFQELSDNTILIMAAAPADYSPITISHEKIKKQNKEISIILKPTIDILKTVGTEYLHRFQNLILVGFAAETHNLEDYMKEKLKNKKLHFICGNIVYKTHQGFGENQNTIFILDKWGEYKTIGPFNKENIAKEILKYLIKRISDVYVRI